MQSRYRISALTLSVLVGARMAEAASPSAGSSDLQEFSAMDARAATILDVTRTFAWSNAEVIGMGGAGIAFAVGGYGILQSPAAPACRRIEAVGPLTGGLAGMTTHPGSVLPDDYLRLYTAGFSLGYHQFAMGLLATGSWYRLEDTWVAVVEGHSPVAVSLMDGRLTLGAGPRLLGMRLSGSQRQIDYLGAGAEAGLVLANLREAWSLALTLRSGVSAIQTGAERGFIDAARLPPELSVGVGWSNLALLARDGGLVPVRVAGDLIVSAPVPDAVALESLLQGERVQRGAWTTVSPRLGAEVDVWPDRLRLRGGTYLEASRSLLGSYRPHVTSGFELRLFHVEAFHKRLKFDLAWQIGVDYAPGYFHGAWFEVNFWRNGLVGGWEGGSGSVI